MANAADWRTAALIDSIRRRGNAPSSSSGWNDTDFLNALNEELRTYVVPLIRRVNEDYLVAYTDVSVVSGTARYRIPEAAMGESLKDVGYLDSQGEFQPIPRIDPGNRDAVSGYYLEDEDVVLKPTPNQSATLRVKYVRRPSKLVDDSRVIAKTTDISNTHAFFGDYALDGETLTSVLGPLIEAATMDIVSARPGFRVIGEGIAVTYATNTFTWSTATSTDAYVGDYLCYTGESPVPQIPAEAHPLLAQATLCQYLRASNQPGLSDAEAGRERLAMDLEKLLAPRTENQPKVIVNRYGAGMVSRYGRNRWR